ncbi:MAG: nucleoside phosphorylase [Erysipelotrichaceae bacterium]|nr:nucleoside phosphorylase [Erysipelotrichaceae bacterium]
MLDKKRYRNMRQYHIDLVEGDVGEYVILPGDPFRTDIIASYLDDARLLNHKREHKSWTGTYKGLQISVVSTGMGCPSTAIAVEELANIGAGHFIRLGTCAGIRDDVGPGDLCISTGVYKQDGTSRRYVPESFPAVPDLKLTSLLIDTAGEMSGEHAIKTGITCSDDAFYAEDEEWVNECHRLGCMNVEMESSVIYTISHLRDLKAATICACAANLYTGKDEDKNSPILSDCIETATKIALETFYRYSLTNE